MPTGITPRRIDPPRKTARPRVEVWSGGSLPVRRVGSRIGCPPGSSELACPRRSRTASRGASASVALAPRPRRPTSWRVGSVRARRWIRRSRGSRGGAPCFGWTVGSTSFHVITRVSACCARVGRGPCGSGRRGRVRHARLCRHTTARPASGFKLPRRGRADEAVPSSGRGVLPVNLGVEAGRERRASAAPFRRSAPPTRAKIVLVAQPETKPAVPQGPAGFLLLGWTCWPSRDPHWEHAACVVRESSASTDTSFHPRSRTNSLLR